MSNEQEIKEKFWKALKSDMTMFLGLAEGEDGHARPMTAQLDDEDQDGDCYTGPIWFFTSTDNHLYQQITSGSRAMAHFVSKGHDVWATVHGGLSQSHDREVIDRLWNRFAAAWYEGGKDDPKLALIRTLFSADTKTPGKPLAAAPAAPVSPAAPPPAPVLAVKPAPPPAPVVAVAPPVKPAPAPVAPAVTPPATPAAPARRVSRARAACARCRAWRGRPTARARAATPRPTTPTAARAGRRARAGRSAAAPCAASPAPPA